VLWKPTHKTIPFLLAANSHKKLQSTTLLESQVDHLVDTAHKYSCLQSPLINNQWQLQVCLNSTKILDTLNDQIFFMPADIYIKSLSARKCFTISYSLIMLWIPFAGKPFQSPSQLLDPKEQRRRRERDRYARMTDQEKQEKLKKRREAYHQKKQTEKNVQRWLIKKGGRNYRTNVCVRGKDMQICNKTKRK
jgi:hypothetical protein